MFLNLNRLNVTFQNKTFLKKAGHKMLKLEPLARQCLARLQFKLINSAVARQPKDKAPFAVFVCLQQPIAAELEAAEQEVNFDSYLCEEEQVEGPECRPVQTPPLQPFVDLRNKTR